MRKTLLFMINFLFIMTFSFFISLQYSSAETSAFMNETFEAEGLPDNIIITSDGIGWEKNYTASQTIEAGTSVWVTPTGDLKLMAGKEIVLKPDFWATSGSQVQALINPILFNYKYLNQTGKKGSLGWEVDHTQHEPGLVAYGLNLPLPEGEYKATFYLRRGSYCDGPEWDWRTVFDILIYDVTADEILPKQSPGRTSVNKRSIQFGDFPGSNVYKEYSIQFTTRGRHGHIFDLRVYWPGSCNGEVDRVELRLNRGIIWFTPDYSELANKASIINQNIEQYHLENGQILTRKHNYDGPFDDQGDSAIWTGLYVAAQAFQFAKTGDETAKSMMENGLHALHRLQILDPNGNLDYVARYVLPNGTTWNVHMPKPSSKDTYAGVMFAYGVSYPFIQDIKIKQMVEEDAYKIARHFIDHDFIFQGSDGTNVNMNPEFLFDEELVPDLPDGIDIEMLQTWYDILIPSAQRALSACGLDIVLPSDPVNGASAIQALHILRVAASIIPGTDEFEQYYYANLYNGKKLMDAAYNMNYSVADTLITCVGDDEDADAFRSNVNHLGYLALYNLISLETNPEVKEKYQKILENLWVFVRDEYNTLYNFIHEISNSKFSFSEADARDGLWSLQLFPLNRRGTGVDYTNDSSVEKVSASISAGDNEYSKIMARHALPMDKRPLDAFIWQRNPRRLKGDNPELLYPGVDYLFVYWMGVYHGMIQSP